MVDFTDLALRHSPRLHPIVHSLLDTDFYKLLMLQFIHAKHPRVRMSFAVHNRTKRVLLGKAFPIEALRDQLIHARTLRFTASELAWLRGQTFYGQRGLFGEGFLDFLATYRLPDFHLARERAPEGHDTGNLVLEFHGSWVDVTLWEIVALTIINELRYRYEMGQMTHDEIGRAYARADVKLQNKLARLAECEGLHLTDFGTRRRHSLPWQEHAVLMAKDVLGAAFTGTSNAWLAMKHGLDAKGTNAHELPMVLAALAEDDAALKDAQYRVLREWESVYQGGLRIFLPDTFGTTQFLEGLPKDMARSWTGARPDSKDPIEGGEEWVRFWESQEIGLAKDKLIIFSDGLDVHLPGEAPGGSDIPTLLQHFQGRCKVGFGFGTNFTNDFRGCATGGRLQPISLVCKAKTAEGRPCVKLSDVYSKATGTPQEIERYRRVFGTAGIKDAPTPLV